MYNFKLTKFEGKNCFEEVEYPKPKNEISAWRNIGNNQSKNIITGEIRDFNPKSLSIRSLKSTIKSLRTINLLILNNFNPDNEIVYSIDFTYRTQPKDYDAYQKDLTKLKRKLKKIRNDVKLIIVKEIGKSNNYHGHMIISNIFLNKEIFKTLWKLGDQIKFQRIVSNEDLIFKSIYLTNIADEYEKSYIKKINGQNFPAKKRLYMKTKNIVMPESITSDIPLDRTGTTTIIKTPDEKSKRTKIKFETFKFDIA